MKAASFAVGLRARGSNHHEPGPTESDRRDGLHPDDRLAGFEPLDNRATRTMGHQFPGNLHLASIRFPAFSGYYPFAPLLSLVPSLGRHVVLRALVGPIVEAATATQSLPASCQAPRLLFPCPFYIACRRREYSYRMMPSTAASVRGFLASVALLG